MHLREDRRHIQDEDVRRLRELTHIKLNLEMAATDEMVAIACRLKPEMAMLVPEGRHEVTTEGGLDVASQENWRKRSSGSRPPASWFRCSSMRSCARSRRRSAPVPRCARSTPVRTRMPSTPGPRRREPGRGRELKKIQAAGEAIRSLGMRFNAGHALNYFNVQPVAALPGVRELHIGHAIVSRAVFVGMREAVREMKALMVRAAAQ